MLVDLKLRSRFVYGGAADAPLPLGARIKTQLDDARVAECECQLPRGYLCAGRIGAATA